MEGHVSLHRGQEAVEIEIDTVPWTREVSRMPLREFWSALPIRLRFMNRHCFILHRNYGFSVHHDIWAVLHDIVSESLKGFVRRKSARSTA